jgi:hypothetical protein
MKTGKPIPDDLTVDAEKFDRILSRMVASKPLSKVEISTRIMRERNAKAGAKMREKNKAYKASKKLGQ